MDRKLDELLFALMQNMMIAVSGEKLAKDLGVSHSTLARWIDKLREAGIEIRGELFTGYRLVRLPDVLLPQLIRPRLRTRIIGRNLYHFYDVDSTNLFASRLIAHGRNVPEGTVVVYSGPTTATRGGFLATRFSVIAPNGRAATGDLTIVLGDLTKDPRIVSGTLDANGRIALDVPATLAVGSYPLSIVYKGSRAQVATVTIR